MTAQPLGASVSAAEAAAGPVATALLQLLGGTPADAAHLASALRRYRGTLRLEGAGTPSSLDALERVFVRVWASRQSASPADTSTHDTGRQGRPELGGVLEPADSGLMTGKQAAARIGCAVRTLQRREAAGELSPIRHGRVVRYRRADVDAYLDQCRGSHDDQRKGPTT